MWRRYPDTEDILVHAHEVELDREHRVRTIACRICGAVPRKRCRGLLFASQCKYAHTGRYNDAAKLGLVPPLPRKPRR